MRLVILKIIIPELKSRVLNVRMRREVLSIRMVSSIVRTVLIKSAISLQMLKVNTMHIQCLIW